MRLLRAAIFAALPAIIWLTPASANVVGFELHLPGCDVCEFGMVPGEVPVVKFWVDDTNFDTSHYPWGIIHESDVVDFTIDAGSFHLSHATQASFYLLTEVIGPDQNLDGSWLGFIASDALDPNVGNSAYISADHWYLGDGACVVDCGFGAYINSAAEGHGDVGTAFFTRVVDTPEPLTLPLFASGLFGLGFQRRRAA